MINLSRKQRESLYRVFNRCPLDHNADRLQGNMTPITYRQFRKKVQPMFCGDGGVMIKWCGMWLGIEEDGYTHS